MIIFSNPGEIDPRLVTTMGVNVKENDSPIGYFGTGLKYALATLLRTGHRVSIHSGLRQFTFQSRATQIRGKEFGMIIMTELAGETDIETELGFTIDLGKNWQPWMAYRELVANAKDEHGGWRKFDLALAPKAGETHIIVDGEGIEQAWRSHNDYFLSSTPTASCRGIEVHRTPGKAIFYRGLRVLELEKPSLFTYNILSEQILTEDRTLDAWYAGYAISNGLTAIEDSAMLKQILSAGPEFYEHGLNFSSAYLPPSEAFVRTIRRLSAMQIDNASQSALDLARQHAKEAFKPEALTLNPGHIAYLSWANETLARMGYELGGVEIKVAASLGPDVLGLSDGEAIWLSQRAFDMGQRIVTSTLLEEFLHHSLGLKDCSRSMQNHLLDKLLALAEGVAP